MSIESAMPSSHLILCCPLLLLLSIFLSIRVFSSESALRIRWPKYWSFSFSISPSNEHPGLIFWDISVIISSSKFLLPFFSPPSGATVMLSLICLMVEGKESACNAGDPGSIPGWGRAPGEGNGYPLQYSCLENLIDRAAWQIAVHGFTKNLTRLSDLTLHTFFTGLYGSITFILFLF